MLKRLTVAVAALIALAGSCFAAGTIPFSLSQQLDNFGKPLAGCQFYTIQAGTTSTPQNAFVDSALTIPLPNPQTCDSAGRLPQMFLADGTIKVRLTDKNGVTIVVADNIQVVGASSGGGGGGTVDPTTILATGDMKVTYGTGVLSGFVRANGRTIGSATSGASERANADAQALFVYLWNTDANLVVSTGRGVSAAADWSANKQITLPDWRDRAIAGLGDMGNSDAARLTSTYFGASSVASCVATTLGCAGGVESQTLVKVNLPPYKPAGSNAASSVLIGGTAGLGVINGSTAVAVNAPGPDSLYNTSVFGTLSAAAQTFTGTDQGGTSTPIAISPPMMLTTIYMKL